MFASLASRSLRLRVYDTQCGAKLFRNTEPVRRVFDQEFISPWAFDVEILARLQRLERERRIPPVTRVVVAVPLQGLSIPNTPGGVFHDPEADAAFRVALRDHLRRDIPVVEVAAHINAPVFAETVLALFQGLMQEDPDRSPNGAVS